MRFSKLSNALQETRLALWEDLQIKLSQWDSHETMSSGTKIVGKLHMMQSYVKLLARIETLAHDAAKTFQS